MGIDPTTTDEIALKYWRYHRPEWHECDSIDEAISSAYWMVEDGNGVPTEIVSLDGRVLLDNDALQVKIEEYDKARPPLVEPPQPPAIPADDAAAALAFARFMELDAASASDWHSLSDSIKDVWRERVRDA